MTMVVPDFWAEGRAQSQRGGHQVTVRRFGWSMTSELDAKAMADNRARDALARVLAGESLPWRDRRVPYNGADGMPIREEVVSRHGEEVVTRNGYGAQCLNSPRLLMADVDHESKPLRSLGGFYFVLMLIAIESGRRWVSADDGTPASGWAQAAGGAVGFLLALAFIALVQWVRHSLRRLSEAGQGGLARIAMRRVEVFMADHPDWGLRVYATPAGLRLMATHRPFAADDPEVARFFDAVQADPHYVAMCRVQHCFRARLTAKPWRMADWARRKSRPTPWPTTSALAKARANWLAAYDEHASAYAACRLAQTLGQSRIAPELANAVALHDDASRALRTDLPLA